MAVEKKIRKKKTKVWNLQFHYMVCAIVIALASFLVYFFSFDSRVHVLACQGNYYLTDTQIFDLAKVSTDTRLWLTPSFFIKSNVYSNPLIEKVEVNKSNGKMTFTVREKTIVGYYVKENKNYMLTLDGESIEIKPEFLKTITHFPLISGFDEKQMKQICKQFKEHEEDLNRNVIEKIAEIVPFEASYDKNMIKMTMQDGNIVYTGMDSLVMMANYQAMLTQLKGQSVCLLLDATHSTIDKISCEDITNPKPKEEPKEESKDKEETAPEENPEDEPSQEDGSSEEVPETQDWVYDEFLGYEYSEALGIYRNPDTGEYYMWSDEIQDLVPFE